MKTFDPALQDHLDEGTATLAWCWRIARADGASFGFTDHDRRLNFDGTYFEPESELTASEVRSGTDVSVDAQDAEGDHRTPRCARGQRGASDDRTIGGNRCRSSGLR